MTWSDNETTTRNQPPVIGGGGFGGAQTRVPATDSRNPFGQDIFVSLVHVEAPPVRRSSRSIRSARRPDSAGFGATSGNGMPPAPSVARTSIAARLISTRTPSSPRWPTAHSILLGIPRPTVRSMPVSTPVFSATKSLMVNPRL